MARSKESVLVKLKEQMDFLLASVRAFYAGQFAESVRIATAIRVLVHETKSSKPLLSQARSNGLELQISEHVVEPPAGEEVFSFVVGARMGPGPEIAPAVDLTSSHRTMSTVGAWWNRTVFAFPFDGSRVVCSRKKIILTLANKEGGAHVDPEEDADYLRLLTNESLTFGYQGIPLKAPDLARFLAAQSGVEMLDCLKRAFFPDMELPLKWEFGSAPVSLCIDHIAASVVTGVIFTFPKAEMTLTKRRSSTGG
jgi:hypothetical protein